MRAIAIAGPIVPMAIDNAVASTFIVATSIDIRIK
jgi:hypothetical protein